MCGINLCVLTVDNETRSLFKCPEVSPLMSASSDVWYTAKKKYVFT